MSPAKMKTRQEAERLLRKYRIKHPPVPVEEIAAALGARVSYSPFEGELAGMLIRKDGQTVIGVNSMHHVNRQRFTIAHECGHLLFHKGDVHIDHDFRVNRRDARSSMAIDPEEIEANRFAAELLMPHDMVMAELRHRLIDLEDEDEIKELARKYQVSVQAMTHRVTNLFAEQF
jgi:Zn-dependent peptidase ImmA (M78 family)